MRAHVKLEMGRKWFGFSFGFGLLCGLQVMAQRSGEVWFEGFSLRKESLVPGGTPKAKTLSDVAIRRSATDSFAVLEDCLTDV